jgi:UDP-glucose 4-epimerase
MNPLKRNVLVTGAAHYWGYRLARELEKDPEVGTLLGIDIIKPPKPFKRLVFFEVTPRHPRIAALLEAAKVDTVFHLLFEESRDYSERVFELNYTGAMDVLGAATAAATPRLIFMSATRIYGARASNPAFLPEETELPAHPGDPHLQQRVDIEKALERHAMKSPLPKITTLRFAGILGPTAKTPMGAYLSADLTPAVLGFDPMFQLVHEDDALAALVCAMRKDVAGPVNVAGPGPLPLSQILRIGGRNTVPMAAPMLRLGGAAARMTGAADTLPMDVSFLKYPHVAETRRMREDLEFIPRYSSKDTARLFFEHLRVKKYKPKEPVIKSDPDSARRMASYIAERLREENGAANPREEGGHAG